MCRYEVYRCSVKKKKKKKRKKERKKNTFASFTTLDINASLRGINAEGVSMKIGGEPGETIQRVEKADDFSAVSRTAPIRFRCKCAINSLAGNKGIVKQSRNPSVLFTTIKWELSDIIRIHHCYFLRHLRNDVRCVFAFFPPPRSLHNTFFDENKKFIGRNNF